MPKNVGSSSSSTQSFNTHVASPFLCAAKLNSLKMVNAFFENQEIPPIEIETALIYAIKNQNIAMIKRLLAVHSALPTNQPLMLYDMDPALKNALYEIDVIDTPEKQKNKLFIAICLNHSDIVKKLLVLNTINIEEEHLPGITYLIKAASLGHADIIKLLIKYGANIFYKNACGASAFDFALYGFHRDAVDALLAATPVVEGKDQRTTLQELTLPKKQFMAAFREYTCSSIKTLNVTTWFSTPPLSHRNVVNEKEQLHKKIAEQIERILNSANADFITKNQRDEFEKIKGNSEQLMLFCVNLNNSLNKRKVKFLSSTKKNQELQANILSLCEKIVVKLGDPALNNVEAEFKKVFIEHLKNNLAIDESFDNKDLFFILKKIKEYLANQKKPPVPDSSFLAKEMASKTFGILDQLYCALHSLMTDIEKKQDVLTLIFEIETILARPENTTLTGQTINLNTLSNDELINLKNKLLRRDDLKMQAENLQQSFTYLKEFIEKHNLLPPEDKRIDNFIRLFSSLEQTIDLEQRLESLSNIENSLKLSLPTAFKNKQKQLQIVFSGLLKTANKIIKQPEQLLHFKNEQKKAIDLFNKKTGYQDCIDVLDELNQLNLAFEKAITAAAEAPAAPLIIPKAPLVKKSASVINTKAAPSKNKKTTTPPVVKQPEKYLAYPCSNKKNYPQIQQLIEHLALLKGDYFLYRTTLKITNNTEKFMLHCAALGSFVRMAVVLQRLSYITNITEPCHIANITMVRNQIMHQPLLFQIKDQAILASMDSLLNSLEPEKWNNNTLPKTFAIPSFKDHPFELKHIYNASKMIAGLESATATDKAYAHTAILLIAAFFEYLKINNLRRKIERTPLESILAGRNDFGHWVNPNADTFHEQFSQTDNYSNEQLKTWLQHIMTWIDEKNLLPTPVSHTSSSSAESSSSLRP